MGKLTKKDKFLLPVLIAFAAGATLYGFVLEPAFTEWKLLCRQADSKKTSFLKNRILVSEAPEIKAEYEKLYRSMKTTQNPEEEIAPFLGDLEKLATQSSMNITSLKPQGVKKSGHYAEILLEVTTETDIQPLLQFLYSVENGESPLRVKRMKILGSNSPNSLRCSLVISKMVIIKS